MRYRVSLAQGSARNTSGKKMMAIVSFGPVKQGKRIKSYLQTTG
jgi:hypothetical protein